MPPTIFISESAEPSYGGRFFCLNDAKQEFAIILMKLALPKSTPIHRLRRRGMGVGG
jgi:hypothetical protein